MDREQYETPNVPMKRATKDEQERRIEFCRALVVRCVRDGAIKDLFRQWLQKRNMPVVSARIIMSYVARARKRIREDAARLHDPEYMQDMTKKGIELLESIIADPSTRQAVRIKAQAELNKMLGNRQLTIKLKGDKQDPVKVVFDVDLKFDDKA